VGLVFNIKSHLTLQIIPGKKVNFKSMSLTILLDLDDTLLSNNMDNFLPVYIKLLAGEASQVPPNLFVTALMSASDKMVRKSQIKGTLESTFDEHFYPAIGFSKEQMRNTLDTFYAAHYPSLKKVTDPVPDAQLVINRILEEGHQIVIATNPLFPHTAVSQRLDWAGFESVKHKFKIVTSFENFHFSKPHPEYYIEILAQLGWPDQSAVMIGNSFKDDIIPAESAGLPTFYLSNGGKEQDHWFTNPLSSSGKMDQVLSWLGNINLQSNQFPGFSATALLAALRVTPCAVETLVKSIPDEFSQQVISKIKSSAASDYESIGIENESLIKLNDIKTVCESFFESRTLLDAASSTNAALKKDPKSLFEKDRTLLRYLLGISS